MLLALGIGEGLLEEIIRICCELLFASWTAEGNAVAIVADKDGFSR